MNSPFWTATVLAASCAICSFAADNTDPLAQKLAQFDASVFTPEQKAAARTMIERDLDRRFRDANALSSAEWRDIDGPAQWEVFRDAKLAALRRSLGEVPRHATVRHQVTGSASGSGYRIENIAFESRPETWVTANLYRPERLRPSMPGFLICHAHHTPKEHGELQDMGILWARAGCYVLVMDQLGHGERAQHPFRSSADYSQSYRVGRQDYYFRYDIGIQLHLIGESLIGWMAWDLMRGVDFLLGRENIDPKRIILLGAVAGGGDPAAVTAALDTRIAAAVPFNFGGPQPETRYPLPEDAEESFHYAGGGSWESTRNLYRSASDGFLPWVIVGGIAPRRLVYAHEFSWDRERDPVWKRLRTIYDYFGVSERLAYTHGRGLLRGRPPEATHCTHIGPPHRKLIHTAFKEWFGIEVGEDIPNTDRHPRERLRAMTPEAERELMPKTLAEVAHAVAAERIEAARKALDALPLPERREHHKKIWSALLGTLEPNVNPRSERIGNPVRLDAENRDSESSPRGAFVERFVLSPEPGIDVPLLLLRRVDSRNEPISNPPVVVALAQGGKEQLLKERAGNVAELLENQIAVCIPDLRGTGETRPGTSRGRRSAATSLSSSELMLGGTMIGVQLRDLRSVIAWLRTRENLDGRRIGLWGESLVPADSGGTNFQIPRDDDHALPTAPEPGSGMVALLGALFEDDVQAVLVRGGLSDFKSVLKHHLALIPHDTVVPGLLESGDVCDLVSCLAPRAVRLEGLVDGWNRIVSQSELLREYALTMRTYESEGAPLNLELSTERSAPGAWLNAMLE